MRVTDPIVRLNTTWPSGPGLRVLAPPVRRDDVDGGTFSVSGNVYLKGPPQTPVARRVRLHDRLTARCVREVWSDPVTGAYSFEAVKAGLYYVVSFDHTGNFNAVIKDMVVAV